MRFSEMQLVITDSVRVLRREAAAVYVGGPENLKELEAAGFVRPIRKTKRSASYDRNELDAAVDRSAREGWPQTEKEEES